MFIINFMYCCIKNLFQKISLIKLLNDCQFILYNYYIWKAWCTITNVMNLTNFFSNINIIIILNLKLKNNEYINDFRH